MSQEHDKSSPDAEVPDGIQPEAPPFEPGYQPETLPKITVSGLADDAQGLTAEALAQVPTLTEEAPGKDLVDEPSEAAEVLAVEEAPVAISLEVATEPIQDTPAQADTWSEELYARMGKLTDDIHTLNVRLDRLEEENKAKV